MSNNITSVFTVKMPINPQGKAILLRWFLIIITTPCRPIFNINILHNLRLHTWKSKVLSQVSFSLLHLFIHHIVHYYICYLENIEWENKSDTLNHIKLKHKTKRCSSCFLSHCRHSSSLNITPLQHNNTIPIL